MPASVKSSSEPFADRSVVSSSQLATAHFFQNPSCASGGLRANPNSAAANPRQGFSETSLSRLFQTEHTFPQSGNVVLHSALARDLLADDFDSCGPSSDSTRLTSPLNSTSSVKPVKTTSIIAPRHISSKVIAATLQVPQRLNSAKQQSYRALSGFAQNKLLHETNSFQESDSGSLPSTLSLPRLHDFSHARPVPASEWSNYPISPEARFRASPNSSNTPVSFPEPPSFQNYDSSASLSSNSTDFPSHSSAFDSPNPIHSPQINQLPHSVEVLVEDSNVSKKKKSTQGSTGPVHGRT